MDESERRQLEDQLRARGIHAPGVRFREVVALAVGGDRTAAVAFPFVAQKHLEEAKTGVAAPLKRSGGVEMACPECGETITTNDAALCVQVENGLRWLGVPCLCGRSLTIEMQETLNV